MSLERSTGFNRNKDIATTGPVHISVDNFYGKNKKYCRIVEILNERQTLESTVSSTLAESQSSDVANPVQDTLLSQHTVSASTVARSVNFPPEVDSRNSVVADQPVAEYLPHGSAIPAQEIRILEPEASLSAASNPVGSLPEIDSLSDVIASAPLLSIDEISRFEMSDDVAAISLIKDDSVLVVAQDNGDVYLLDTLSGAIQREWRQASQNNHPVEPMQTSDEEASMDDGSELASDEEPMDYDSDSDDDTRVSCLALSVDQQQFAVGRDDGQIRLYNLSNARGPGADNACPPQDCRQMPKDECVGLAFTANERGLGLIAVRENGRVDLCDIQNGSVFLRQQLSIGQRRSDHMASLVTSHTVASTVTVITPSNVLQQVNALTGECHSIGQLGAGATAVLETDDYYGIAHCPSDGQAELFIYDRHTGDLRHQMNVSPDEIKQGKLTMSSDGRWLLCGARGRIRMVDLYGFESERTIAIGSHWELAGLACHPERPWIVLAHERMVRIGEVIAQESGIMQRNAWVEE
ncbi:hypothetical protein [Kistimonas asteriae]|uniref:hypothetical protein n=1 Tax=Kistimonas asteriae TaxID=517724 RepID=UPI001BADF793|nr:hypothetical protein [Kistimonas asteriae]